MLYISFLLVIIAFPLILAGLAGTLGLVYCGFTSVLVTALLLVFSPLLKRNSHN